MESPEVHVHPHHTGHRWVDYLLAGTALLVSVISLWVAIGHGRTMEKLVAANSWPYVDGQVNIGPAGETKQNVFLIRFSNSGVGPAQVRSLEVFDGARRLRGFDDLIRLVRAAFPNEHGKMGFASLNGAMIPRDGHVNLLVFSPPAMSDASVGHALPIIQRLHFRWCYCSVFDECFVGDDRIARARPQPIAACPANAALFDDDPANSKLVAQSLGEAGAAVEPAAARR